MKIPHDNTDPKSDSCRHWQDVICDKCGKSCRDGIGLNFEYATIKADWGFGSDKDTQSHEAHVCEPCYDGFGLKPKVTKYL